MKQKKKEKNWLQRKGKEKRWIDIGLSTQKQWLSVPNKQTNRNTRMKN